MKQYTYYGFQDDLCEPGEHDSYRMGPNGLEFQVEETNGELVWVASGFQNMDDLLNSTREYGDMTARYWEIDVDG